VKNNNTGLTVVRIALQSTVNIGGELSNMANCPHATERMWKL